MATAGLIHWWIPWLSGSRLIKHPQFHRVPVSCTIQLHSMFIHSTYVLFNELEISLHLKSNTSFLQQLAPNKINFVYIGMTDSAMHSQEDKSCWEHTSFSSSTFCFLKQCKKSSNICIFLSASSCSIFLFFSERRNKRESTSLIDTSQPCSRIQM